MEYYSKIPPWKNRTPVHKTSIMHEIREKLHFPTPNNRTNCIHLLSLYQQEHMLYNINKQNVSSKSTKFRYLKSCLMLY